MSYIFHLDPDNIPTIVAALKAQKARLERDRDTTSGVPLFFLAAINDEIRNIDKILDSFRKTK